MHKIDNIGIITSFVFPYISNFLLYLCHKMFVNMKLDISGCKSSTFQGYRIYWSSCFPMAQPKKLTILAFLYCKDFAKTSILS